MTFHKHKSVSVSTLAGKEGYAGPRDPEGIAIDAAGNLYVTDINHNCIYKVTPQGEFSTIAGSEEGFADGTGTAAQFNYPYGIARDATGNLYVADTHNHSIRKVTPKGKVSTLAGNGEEGFADGTGSAARFHFPHDIVIDAAGNLYVTDCRNYRIRKVTPKGEVSTFAGSDTEGGADGQGSAAQFGELHGIAIDAAGNLYVTDHWRANRRNYRVRKVTPRGEVSTLAGGSEGEADGIGSAAQFDGPTGIAIDAAGNLYVTDQDNHRIRKITPKGAVSTLAGSEQGYADGTGIAAQFCYPSGIAIDAKGNLYVADTDSCIRKVTPEGEVSSFPDNAQSFADGTGDAARFSEPYSIALDAAGNLYVADTGNHCIRKVTPQGGVSTFAGNGEYGFVDGTGSAAQFNSPRSIAIDTAENLYVADTGNHCIRKVTPKGGVSTLAGNGEYGFADGAGIAARFNEPFGIAIDAAGNLYVADTENHRIRKVTPEGVVSTLAGSQEGDADGSSAQFYYPGSIAVDAACNLYVADVGNHRIRKITPEGVVSTLAGSKKGFVDGEGSAAQFKKPRGITVDAAGNLFVADGGNHRIRMVMPTGEVCTLAGGMGGFADGLGEEAQFQMPSGVAIDAAGNLYVADSLNNRIRKIETVKMIFPFSILYSLLLFLLGFLERRKQKLEKALAEYEDEDENEDENVDVDDDDTSDDTDDQESAAWFDSPHGIAVDAAGNLYVVDSWNYRICKITPTGDASVLAGGSEGLADGRGSDAQFDFPSGIAIDAAGNLYVADEYNHRIRKVTPNGKVSTLAGGSDSTGDDSEGGFADGQGSAAQFSHPSDIAIDATGNLYVADRMNHCIRKVTPTGEVSTIAGRGATGLEKGGFADGQGSAARFDQPHGITIDTAGILYVVEFENHCIRKVTPTGEVSTLAGNGTSGDADGAGRAAQFDRPQGIAIDAAGNLYVADTDNHRIRKITPTGEVSTFAGSGTDGDADGKGSDAQFDEPASIAIDATGNLYVADSNNNSIRKITPNGEVSTFNESVPGFASNTESVALFCNPHDIATDAAGNLYVADTDNHRILKVTPNGEADIFAGSGTAGSVDGPGNIAQFRNPSGIAVDREGNLYVVDKGNHRIRKVSPKGEVRSFVGSTEGFADGQGSTAQFNEPYGIAIDAEGSLYVTDNNCIRKVTPKGEVSTFAGNDEQDDADENAIRFCSPEAIAIDATGSLYVVDKLNNRICKVTPTGEVSVLAGSGKDGHTDGIGSSARFRDPSGIAVDAKGNLYVADSGNECIRKITPTGEVSTFAGSGTYGDADGKGSDAQFDEPASITIDAKGNLYVADSNNDSIRKITPQGEVSTLVKTTYTPGSQKPIRPGCVHYR